MLTEGREVENGAVIEREVCVVGAGPAGITLARELAAAKVPVCLIESGGFKEELPTHGLSEGVNVGTFMFEYHPYLTDSRRRLFGGTTNMWAGWCRPLDAHDFEVRPWVPFSGWPISRSDLDPFYDRAAPAVQIRPFDYPLDEVVSPFQPLLLEKSDRVVTKIFHYSPPTRFGEVYRNEIVDSELISLFLHSNVIRIHTNGNGVESVDVGVLEGPRFKVKAKHFVLACGGIENARHLLLNNIGNQHDQVGRYFADHPHVDAGLVAVSDGGRFMRLYERHVHALLKQNLMAVLALSPEVQEAEQLLNMRIYLKPVARERLADLHRAIGRNATRIDNLVRSEAFHDRPDLLDHPELREPSYFALDVSCECTPNPESRVTLLPDRTDPFGNARVHLDWQLDPEDNRSIRRGVEVLGRELGRFSQGRAQLVLHDENQWPSAFPGSHHMGTARMSAAPRGGVVDTDLRVHGMTNLYVAGSAVFPTGGFANPTLTIVALSVRLSDHLRRVIGV